VTPGELDVILLDLVSGNNAATDRARDRLLDLAREDAQRQAVSEATKPLLTHESARVRGMAFVILAEALGEEAIPLLSDHLDEKDAGARYDLVHALGAAGAREPLVRLVADPVQEVRFLAAVELAAVGNGAGVPALLEGLSWAQTRFQALSALYRLGERSAVEPARKLLHRVFVGPFERTAAAGLLARLGDDEARAFLVRRVASRRGDDRGLAIELVGDLRLLGATDALVATLQDRRDVFRGAAARALGMIGDDRLREFLVRVLLDEKDDPDTRSDAAEGLLHLGTPLARQALEAATREIKDGEVLAVVREALETASEVGKG
jgi:HEAT repeat protein